MNQEFVTFPEALLQKCIQTVEQFKSGIDVTESEPSSLQVHAVEHLIDRSQDLVDTPLLDQLGWYSITQKALAGK